MSETDRKHNEAAAPVRVDKWLWAARFFKTRSLAAKAVKGGKVRINEHRAKASTTVRAGDRVDVTKGETAFEVEVTGLSDQRGPASVAETLYVESEASRKRREAQSAERRSARLSMPRPTARPDKKQRRQLRRFKQGE
ncbi:RNA-binding S4 domain-containing protein [Salinisphaera orenii]|uniref:Heat shock protein 15 n=1 Tax=Salinisphaera orenii YIM 95161 TaxID=1051139 RepID=A0A423QBE4_9GAMM|nr:S4 domain-containing protein [Salinisphaera halophila]ROO37747.1 ribosome-associated heat shock protein Hsp15 [Salinisphaera halophila YIM 95161]